MKTWESSIYLGAAAVALGISACGSSGGGGGGGAGPADLSSPDKAAQQAANVASLISKLGDFSALANPGASPKNIDENFCDSGMGADFDETAQAVDSPYTSSTFDLSGVQFTNCQVDADFNQGGVEDDFIRYNGRTEAGGVSEGGSQISYSRVGSRDGSPLALTIHIEGETQGVTFNQDFTYNIGVVTHSSSSATETASETFAMFTGGISQSGFDFDFGFRLGDADADDSRFSISETSDGLSINGSYSTDFPSFPGSGQDFECSGSASIATVAPLVEGSGGDFSAGELDISNGSETANIVFSGSQVTVNAGGSTQTFAQSDLRANADTCSSLALFGFAFANF